MAKISARGARKVGEIRARRADEGLEDVTYVYVLCSDGRVLVRHERPSGYTTPGLPATIRSAYSVAFTVSAPTGLAALEVDKVAARLERAGLEILGEVAA